MPGVAYQLPPHFWPRYYNAQLQGKSREKRRKRKRRMLFCLGLLRIVDHLCILRDSNV
jgi:hypothetical protein